MISAAVVLLAVVSVVSAKLPLPRADTGTVLFFLDKFTCCFRIVLFRFSIIHTALESLANFSNRICLVVAHCSVLS